MYKGKEICQACKKTGKEQPRPSKDSLCHHCQLVFKQGLADQAVKEIRFVNVFAHFFAFRNNVTNKLVHELFEAINVKHVKYYNCINSFSYTQEYKGSNGRRYNIDDRLLEPLRKLFCALDDELYNIAKERQQIPHLVNEYIALEKDKIFNEGIEKGKKLIFMLNSGEISMDDFTNKKYIYHGFEQH